MTGGVLGRSQRKPARPDWDPPTIGRTERTEGGGKQKAGDESPTPRVGKKAPIREKRQRKLKGLEKPAWIPSEGGG